MLLMVEKGIWHRRRIWHPIDRYAKAKKQTHGRLW